MAPKVFITGGTGYIGGSVLHTFVTAHPEYEVTALLRKEPETFASTYPRVKIIKGDYESGKVLSQAASAADVVIHCGDSDHEASLNAIIHGLLQRTTPGFLLHLSGTGIIADWNYTSQLGKLNSKVWSDVEDLTTIRSLPDHALHRNTEKILHDTIAKYDDKIKIAIVCPPDIYGTGKGLSKTWSVFIPMYVRQCAEMVVSGFYLGDGTNTRSWVHIDDLMGLYAKLVEDAVAGGKEYGWGKEGYYFAATQDIAHIDLVRAVGGILEQRGISKTAEPVELTLGQIDATASFPNYPFLGRYLYASNSRSRPQRAKELWGYEASAPPLLEVVEQEVLAAIKMLGNVGAAKTSVTQ